jgi:uncharacterized membrane-anchored protein
LPIEEHLQIESHFNNASIESENGVNHDKLKSLAQHEPFSRTHSTDSTTAARRLQPKLRVQRSAELATEKPA